MYIQIYDAQRQAAAYVALDTGAVFTVITPALARQIGLKDSLGTLPIVSATGSQQANRYRVGYIQLGSEKITNLEVLNLPVQLANRPLYLARAAVPKPVRWL